MSFASISTRATLALTLLCTALSSGAMTLGRLQGQATLGKPLDVSVQVMLDGPDDNTDCLAADVVYGDIPLTGAQVSVRMESGSSSGSMASTLRISSTVVVNEPIVSMNVRVGCRQKSSRQYTLFTELPSAVSTPASTQASPAVAPAPSAIRRDTPPPAQASAPATSIATAATVRVDGRKTPKASAANAASSVQASVAAKLPSRSASAPRKPDTRSRLRIDPLELLLEPEPTLRFSTQILNAPSEEMSPERAQAAVWWRALNASPEDALRDAARLDSVQNDIQSLQAVASSNQKRLTELADKVQRAESEKYANGLVYALAALCLLSLLAVGFLWKQLRQARAPSWSQALDPGDSMMAYPEPEPSPEPPSPGVPPPPPRAAASLAPTAPPPPRASVDLDLDLTEPAQAVRHNPRDFSTSIFPSSRAMDSEELLDIRQQADFFLTVEQHEKAIELLSTRIAQCGESSPLICLDLLKIYHSLGRKADFDILRAEFNHWFTGRVPEFASFQDEGRPLSSYPPVLNRIVELWPAHSVLDYIENCIYQHSSTQPDADFDLQAYRELLLLHSIAKRIMRLAYGNEDEHPSEFMRIPASAAGLDPLDAEGATDSRAAAHRAGAHLRGTWNPGIQQNSLDANADAVLPPSISPLGAMRVPVHVATPDAPLDFELEPAEPKVKTSDFSFTSLR